MASFLASSVKAQVLTMMTSASSSEDTTVCPAATSRAIIFLFVLVVLGLVFLGLIVLVFVVVLVVPVLFVFVVFLFVVLIVEVVYREKSYIVAVVGNVFFGLFFGFLFGLVFELVVGFLFRLFVGLFLPAVFGVGLFLVLFFLFGGDVVFGLILPLVVILRKRQLVFFLRFVRGIRT